MNITLGIIKMRLTSVIIQDSRFIATIKVIKEINSNTQKIKPTYQNINISY
ncbi:hypothetical protein bmyco0003_58200 [Bacillus pseudomycoides]|nr:hypothetical protein bmyco0003_58200 [Bacillus pseudomycoides]